MIYKYGEFSENQIAITKVKLRSKVRFLLKTVDPKTKNEYKDVDINKTFENLLIEMGGLNNLLFCPPELVEASALLKSAQMLYNSPDFRYPQYRKLVLDAGVSIGKIKEV